MPPAGSAFGPPAGFLFAPRRRALAEPARKRAIAFVDGQNLFHSAREAFGYRYPNYDPRALAQWVCHAKGWTLSSVFFYTGMPDPSDNPRWSQFWVAKLGVMGTRGVTTVSRPLRYREQAVRLSDGTATTTRVGIEKGIDVRIALDMVRLARQGAYDVAILFSQDQDLAEVAAEIRVVAREESRWIKIASAFPISPASRNRRGVDKTDWIPIDRAAYGACLDPNRYLPDLL